MPRAIDPQDAQIVGVRLLAAPDRYLLDGCEEQLGMIVARADPELFREIIEDKEG